MKTVKDYTRSDRYKQLRDAIYKALDDEGNLTEITADKVEEYMDFWVQRQQLRDDVINRGLIVTDERGRIMENRSVSLGVQVARQMMDIAKLLRIVNALEEVDEL